MGLFNKLAGTLESFFRVGGVAGPGFNSNSGALEARNAANSAYAVMRGASPVGDNDLTTKQYVDTIAKPIPVALQFNGGSALPSNTGTEQYYVVTTSGANATIGQLLWDDGTGSGTVQVMAALTDRTILTAAGFSGGTITLQSGAFYYWTGSAWALVAGTVTGALQTIRYALTNANGAQDSATQIPANAVVTKVRLIVTTPFSGGATISIGQAGSTSLLMATTDNTPQTAVIYESDQDTAWGGSPLAVRATIAGAPAAGAGFVYVEYTLPNL